MFDPDRDEAHLIQEGKWIPIRSSGMMRIDHPTHGVGQTHAHLFGRRGTEVGVVNLDGTGSHGTNMRLTQAQADALSKQGFAIRPDRIVEWVMEPSWTRELLLG